MLSSAFVKTLGCIHCHNPHSTASLSEVSHYLQYQPSTLRCAAFLPETKLKAVMSSLWPHIDNTTFSRRHRIRVVPTIALYNELEEADFPDFGIGRNELANRYLGM